MAGSRNLGFGKIWEPKLFAEKEWEEKAALWIFQMSGPFHFTAILHVLALYFLWTVSEIA